ncbi:MAG: GNAT family N-acetyltransferase [Candidatus Binatia bacterium]
MRDLEIREAQDDEVQAAAAVLSRAMRDNPINIAAFGNDPELRRKKLARVFGTMLPLMPQRPLLGLQDGTVAAVWGTAEPGSCQLTGRQKLRMTPAILACGIGTTSRVLTWLGEWGARDMRETHWHLGPVGVDAQLQGRGIGSQMMREWCRLLDLRHVAGYLETDKSENVRFYGNFGFDTIAEAEILRTPNWFMVRGAR